MTNKKRISFELTDNWPIEGFRNFIKMLLSEDEKYDIYIISNDDNTAFIKSVGESLNLDSSRVLICNFTDDKLDKLRDNKINIHFDNLQSFVMLTEETTDAYGILVTRYLNKFYSVPDYVLVFNRRLDQLNEEE